MAQEILIPVRREKEMEEINLDVEESTWCEEIAWYAGEVASIARYIFRACLKSPVLLSPSWPIALLK